MTLDGTNSYVVRHPQSRRVVIVDPGPRADKHVRAIMAAGEIELILLTHSHYDHSESALELSQATNAPVRAIDPEWCAGADPLEDGEVLHVAGTFIEVVATPGHTADSACFLLPDDRLADQEGSLLAGDTILGRGTSVIAAPDGSLRDYLASLARIRDLGRLTLLPGHGPRVDDSGLLAADYIQHRLARLEEVRRAVQTISGRSGLGMVTVEHVTDLVYAAITPQIRFAAESSVAAQLTYLSE
jgi:glyoxylase-like metal-dependent hydrolase (beta-lactamase superfamily II)